MVNRSKESLEFLVKFLPGFSVRRFIMSNESCLNDVQNLATTMVSLHSHWKNLSYNNNYHNITIACMIWSSFIFIVCSALVGKLYCLQLSILNFPERHEFSNFLHKSSNPFLEMYTTSKFLR